MSALVVTTDHAIELRQLPKACRDDAAFWREQLEPVLLLKRGTTAALEQIAKATETGKTTVIRKFYALKEQGIIGLIDRRLAGPRWWKQSAATMVLPLDDKALVKLYCEQNDRSSRSAVKQLRADWRKGKVKTNQPKDPRTGYPRGWSIDNLLRHVSDDYELEAARKGTAPATAHRRLVYTTRKDLWVGSHYMFDDMWHNFFVNSFAENQSGRPLELFSHDLFSARKVRYCVRVRTEGEDGKKKGVTGSMTRYCIAATLSLDGFSPRGTILCGEHGTATWADEVAKAVYEHSGKLITSEFGGMQGAKAHAGQYPGVRRGNPRAVKASLESSNNLVQNVFGHLPGQTGKDIKDRPEQLAALLDENERWLALYDRLSPASQHLVQFALLEFHEFMHVAQELYAQIENDPDHDLEGWVQAHNVTTEMLIGGNWMDRSVLAPGSAEEELALALIGQGKLVTRPRKLTRREVWDRGARELLKLNGAGVVAILGEDLAKPDPLTVQKGMFVFEDEQVEPGELKFEGVIFDPRGQRTRLPEGEKYTVFINPFAPDRLFVCDAKLAYLGEAKRIVDPSRANKEAGLQMVGHVKAEEVERLLGVRERHAAEGVVKADRERINLALESGAPVTEEQHDAADAAKRDATSTLKLGKAVRKQRAPISPASPAPAVVENWDEAPSEVPTQPSPTSTTTEIW